MLAKAVPDVPEPDSVRGGLRYEPKWDGFRGIVTIDGDDVEIGSRGAKPLTRYFPELVEAFRAQFGGREHPVVLDGEVVLRTGEPGHERLDWEALSQRIHPAASRIAKLSVETPAMFVAFDLLAADGDELTTCRSPSGAPGSRPWPPTSATRCTSPGRRWTSSTARAGSTSSRAPGWTASSRSRASVRTSRASARCSRSSTTGPRTSWRSGTASTRAAAGSGRCWSGCTTTTASSARSAGCRRSPTSGGSSWSRSSSPSCDRDADGRPVTGDGEKSRFSSGRDTSFVRLRPERVLEVRYDQMEGDRFRHTVQFERWRPDRDARSCGFEQLEVPGAYDLGKCCPECASCPFLETS